MTGRLRPALFYGVAIPAVALAAIAGVMIGSTALPWQTVVKVLAAKLTPTGWIGSLTVPAADVTIVWLMRLPRVLVAGIVGAGLATAGVLMQALFRNPLAEPSLTGVGPGAVLGAVTMFVTGWSSISLAALPVASMVVAFGALVLVYAIASRDGVAPVMTLLLAGIAVGAFLTALSGLLLTLNITTWQVAQDIVFWMMGGLEARTWAHVWLSAPFVAVGIASAFAQSRTLDLLLLGDENAGALGVDVEAAKRLVLITSALLTGASVAAAGLIGFVGLVVPHGVRLLLGPAHRTLLPASALAGGAFLIICDLIARTARPPAEIRLGVMTALCGAPAFLFLLLRQLREAAE